jgi:glycosyltransferase involved in cell wall biosynthesis
MLRSAGFVVSIIGSNISVLDEPLPVEEKFFVEASGTGSLYSIARVDKEFLESILVKCSPRLVIVEGWQTALSSATIKVANALNIPILMISHGISIHPFNYTFKGLLRALAWVPFRVLTFPRLLSRIDVLTALDMDASSARFFDRDYALRVGKPVYPLVNSPVNYKTNVNSRLARKQQVLVIGYFSPIKNQLSAIDVANKLPDKYQFKFIGRKCGSYYRRCRQRVFDLKLTRRIQFLEDSECDLAYEIGASLAVFAPSITEVLPLTLLESMASGTPYVASPVGAVPALKGGVLARNIDGWVAALSSLLENRDSLWDDCSRDGINQYSQGYTKTHVERQLLYAIESLTSMRIQRA